MLLLKHDIESNTKKAGLLNQEDINPASSFVRKQKSQLGKIKLQLNALKRRRQYSNHARWEMDTGYLPVLAGGVWNKLLFGREIIRGDYCYITGDRWIFRAQRSGFCRVSSMVTLDTTNWINARLGLFKNNTYYSDLRIIQCRRFEPVDIVWIYDTIIDLAGSSDLIYIAEGEEIDIRLKFTALATGWAPLKIVGWVNVNFTGTIGNTVNQTLNNWG